MGQQLSQLFLGRQQERQCREAALGPGWAPAFTLLGLHYFSSKTRIFSLLFQGLEKLPLYGGSRGGVVSHKDKAAGHIGPGLWALSLD